MAGIGPTETVVLALIVAVALLLIIVGFALAGRSANKK